MHGYIGVTDYDWFQYHKSKNHSIVIFWRKAVRPVRLARGMYFFFLVKRSRLIHGWGIVETIGPNSINLLWEQYGNKLGADTKSQILTKLGKTENEIIGFYKIREVNYLSEESILGH